NVFIDGCLAADIPLTDGVIELLDLICDIEHRKGTPQLWDIKAKDLGLSGFTDKKLLMLYAMLKDDGDMTGIEDKDIVFNLNPRYAVRKAEPEVVPIPEPVMPQREKTPFDIMLEQLAAARNIAAPAQAKKAVTKLENGILTVADEVVADNAYRGRSDIRKVILLEGVREVGNGAFCSCSNLEAVDVPESLEKLGAEAFSWCTKLKHFDLPGSLKTIGNEAFYRCGGLCSYSGTYEDKELGYDAFFASGIYPEVVAKIHTGIIKPCDADGYGARTGTLTGYAELNDPRVGGSRNSGFAQGFNADQPSGLNSDFIEFLKKLGL
ncbi:MAG: leucine-rich repeat domain-containing protein, partial [Clostridia bacterium]|nr:leucine-rich repeat domain-containing protein [Clostridia bacterium]